MSGPLWQGPGQHSHTLPSLPRPRGGSAAADPMAELSCRMEDVIAEAVHPDEIAAILESDGMTDDHIRSTYGRQDSFTLAEELYARVPRRHAEPPGPPADPWRAGLLECLLRGLVFALPGLAYVLGAPLLRGATLAPLLAGALTGWVWNQALSHRAYSWLALGDRPAAALCLLRGAPTGAFLGGAAAALAAEASTAPGRWPAAAFATAQALYLAAATALLVLDRERALLGALLPVAAGATAVLLHGLPTTVRTSLLLVSLLAATALATRALHASQPSRRLPGRPRTGCAPPAPRAGAAGSGRPRLCGVTGAVGPLPRARRRGEPGPGRARPGDARRAVRWRRAVGVDAVGAAGVRAVSESRRSRRGDKGLVSSGAADSGGAAVGVMWHGGPARVLLSAVRRAVRWPRARGLGEGPRDRRGGGPSAGPRLAASVPYGVFGLGAGLIVLHTALGDVLAGRDGAVVAAPSAVALTLSTGPAEWLLLRFRSGSLAGLRASTTARDFRRIAAAVLAECLALYLAVLFALALVGTLLWPAAPALGGVRLATLLLIGTVLWTGLLLQSFGAVTPAAAVCGGAALVQSAALITGTGGPRTVGLCVAAVAAALLAGLVCVLLGRATAHRV